MLLEDGLSTKKNNTTASSHTYDTNTVDSGISTNRETSNAPIMNQEFEEAMRSLMAGVDNVPAKLLVLA